MSALMCVVAALSLAGSADSLDARTDALARQIRCPVCQGSSIADSPSSMAIQMKAEVREELARGLSEEEILAKLERAYGEQIRLSPKAEGFNRFLFWAPALALVTGLVAAWRVIRKGQS